MHKKYDFKITDAIEDIPQEAMDMILYGGNEKFSVVSKVMGITKDYKIDFEGISNFIKINMIIPIQQVLNVGQKNLWMKMFVQNVKELV